MSVGTWPRARREIGAGDTQREPLDRRREAVALRHLLRTTPEQLDDGPTADAAPVGIARVNHAGEGTAALTGTAGAEGGTPAGRPGRAAGHSAS